MKDIFELYQHFLKYPHISTDSRADIENTIFFALKGDNFNGNLFAETALKKGAKLAVIDDKKFYKGDQSFLVEDTLTALQELACHHRKQNPIQVIGITGSNGKTTTKELVAAVLRTTYNISYTQGNLNNHIGVPLSLLEIRNSTELAIIEMGANHIGEISQLCQIAQPDIGIITNIGKAHIEGFGSFEGVIKAKGELYKFIQSKQNEVIVNADDKLLMQLSNGLNRFTYGISQADLEAKLVRTTPYLNIKWSFKEQEFVCRTGMYGQYNFYNILAAIALGLRFDISPDKINKAIELYKPDNNRSQQLKTESNQIIMDAYNANPVSMKEAILSFKEFNPENPWLILGDMFELGHISLNEHQLIIDLLKEESFEKVLLVGNDFYQLKDTNSFISFETTEEAMDYLAENTIRDASILIKGSRGMQLESLVKSL